MDNNDILDLKSISQNNKQKNKRSRKRGDGSKTREGNNKALEKRTKDNVAEGKQRKQNRFNSTKKQAEEAGISYTNYSALERKLEGITDNTDRMRIVNEYLDARSKTTNGSSGRSLKKDINKFSPYNGPKAPYMDNNKEVHKSSLKDKANNAVIPFKDTFNKFLNKVAGAMPNSVSDIITASSHGVQTRSTTLGKIGNIIGASEATGYNPITKSNINIDYLSNKIDTQQNRYDIKEKDGFFKQKFKAGYNKLSDSIGKRNMEHWKRMHIEETSKSVRTPGANINPFDSGENLDYVRQKRLVGDLSEKLSTSTDPSLVSKELKEAQGKLSNMYGNDNLHYVRDRDALQLKEVEKRISDSKNNVKMFFNPIDKSELSMLENVQNELTERLRRIDGGYGAGRVNTDAIDIPKSVAETFKDQHERRVNLYNQINSSTGNTADKPWMQVQRAGIAFPEDTFNKINNNLAEHKGIYDNFSISRSENLGGSMHLKDYKPVFGTTGYGLGFMNSFKASRTEHLMRGLHFMNPLGAGGASAGQAIMETFGVMNRAQRMQAAQARGFGKLGSAMVPGLGAAQLLMGMYNKEDAGQIFEDMFSMGTSLAGWRAGAAIGGGIGGGSASVGRLLGLGIGGLTGMALGYGIGVGVVGGVRDIVSNESKIRSFAKKVGTKEAIVSQQQTVQSLTSRQASLQKLARSGLNDRGLLLGNEATVLATGG